MRPAHDWRHSFRRLHTGSDYLEIYQVIAPIPRIDARSDRDGRAQATPGMRVVIVAKGRDGMPGDAGAILSRCVLLGGGVWLLSGSLRIISNSQLVPGEAPH